MAVPSVVFADANVLYAPAVRDLLVELALARVIILRWSQQVHDEWTRALLRNRPDLPPDRPASTRAKLDAVLPQASVTGYEHRIDGIELPDPDDRHVVAAAIEAQCQYILTFNTRDFPAEVLSPHQLTPMHPDLFLATVAVANPIALVNAAQISRRDLRDPPYSPADYLASLADHGLPLTAKALAPFQDQI